MEYQKFPADEDYSCGLTDVPDREFEAQWDGVYQPIKALLGLGEVQEGLRVELLMVPHSLQGEPPWWKASGWTSTG